MTRSVEELKRESERNRAALEGTVGQLRERLSGTAQDLRQMASPQHIKSEVSDYFGQKAQSWLGALRQYATDNPMQAIAAGTAAAVPVFRLARGFPLPLLMIGAGLALTSKGLRSRAAEAAEPAVDKAKEMLNHAAESAQAIGSNVISGISSAGSRLNDVTSEAQDGATGLSENLISRATQTGRTVADNVKAGVDAARDTVERARSTAADTLSAAATAGPAKARKVVGENAAVVGGLGIAIGAIIAASLPKTDAEAKVLSRASGGLKDAAKQASQSAMSAADAAANTIAGKLDENASRMTQNMSDTLKQAADDVIAAAFTPSSNPDARKKMS